MIHYTHFKAKHTMPFDAITRFTRDLGGVSQCSGNSGDLCEQAVVKPVLSLSKGRARDFFAGIPHVDSALPGSGIPAGPAVIGHAHTRASAHSVVRIAVPCLRRDDITYVAHCPSGCQEPSHHQPVFAGITVGIRVQSA